ncbi:dihydroorotate dehydrogenase [Salisediminibacterium halotolerans]|uniref:Dihydroorotate dehydrogenase n=1 Tax=Salisediminibacterium halotolerans TaxID=517425 RepID=A0A1H9QKI4_9BACI|nr:dihydroorotate dehydrogenase [Salisediminibacterium haloalkalitolerans]SER60917.1 dihydroorotate dehydrogenase (NAD+) catalytic subunit [Salisediminibacterium haloalkalitolerans]
MTNADGMAVSIGSLTLKTPVMPASGAFGPEMEAAVDFNEIGALVPKSITKKPQPGNSTPRVCETYGGMINSIGIQSKGVDVFIEKIIPQFARYETPLIASISAEDIDEFIEMTEKLAAQPEIDALELNISCPNLKANGLAFGMDKDVTYELISRARAVTDLPLIAKLTPNVTSIQEIARAAENAGADALTVANTFLAMAIDPETREPLIGNNMGGLSGPAVKPIIVRMVYQTAQVTTIPIIGCGGVMNGRDAIEMILAGATCVQVGTASFLNPTALTDITEEIRDYMTRHGVNDIHELIGGVKMKPQEGGVLWHGKSG